MFGQNMKANAVAISKMPKAPMNCIELQLPSPPRTSRVKNMPNKFITEIESPRVRPRRAGRTRFIGAIVAY
jgi:hypothetical protein